MIKVFVVLFFIFVSNILNGYSQYQDTKTTIKTENVTVRPGRIIYKLVNKPHNLFIGRCIKKYPAIHQENLILNNDGKSHVSANIRMNIDGAMYITCVNIYDENPDIGAYPSYVAGGVGHNFVEFTILTGYGKGFKFFVQIFGYRLS